MSTEQNKDTFSYAYSARQIEEIKQIRGKYTPKENKESNIERLRRLDASVTGMATAVALVFGVIGALIMGTGMSLIMSDLGSFLFSNTVLLMIVGISLGIIGIALMALAYPLYFIVAKRRREKIAPEIIRITDELMK